MSLNFNQSISRYPGFHECTKKASLQGTGCPSPSASSFKFSKIDQVHNKVRGFIDDTIGLVLQQKDMVQWASSAVATTNKRAHQLWSASCPPNGDESVRPKALQPEMAGDEKDENCIMRETSRLNTQGLYMELQ
jgi:hypothetical protein